MGILSVTSFAAPFFPDPKPGLMPCACDSLHPARSLHALQLSAMAVMGRSPRYNATCSKQGAEREARFPAGKGQGLEV
jgi:hypothetical protein